MKIEMTIRAAGIAAELLSLVKSPGKLHSRLVLQEAGKQFRELAEFVQKLPED